MEVNPTPDQQAFIRQAIESGRIARPEDAAAEAMALWEERERRRAAALGSRVGNPPAFRPVAIRGEALSSTVLRDRR